MIRGCHSCFLAQSADAYAHRLKNTKIEMNQPGRFLLGLSQALKAVQVLDASVLRSG